jgi:hypothetical protein
VPQPKIIPPGLGSDSGFGRGGAVDAAGDTLLVGAWNSLSGTDPGRVYVYQYDGTTWNEETQLVASDAAAHLAFGVHLDVDASGTVAVVANNGGAYVFRRVGGTWGEEQILSTTSSGSIFAESVVVSADGRTAAYLDEVYRFDGAQWASHGALVANDSNPLHAEAIDDDGDTIVAFVADDYDGAPYVFRHDGASWVQEQRLLMPAGVVSYRTKAALDAFGETVLVSGRAAGSGPRTWVRYGFDGSAWVAGQELTATKAGDDLAGSIAVSADATQVVIGTSIPGPCAGGVTSLRWDAPATFCYGAAAACPGGPGGLPGRGGV